MMPKKTGVFFSVAVLGIAATGCTGQMVQTASGPMPDYCVSGVANPVNSAILGAGIGALAGGGKGAAIGAGAGAALGGLTGAQMASNCRQYAMRNFMAMMAAQAAAQAAAQRAGQMGQVASYQTYDYYAPSPQDGQPAVRHQIRQTSHYTDPATKADCGNYSEISFGANGQSSVTGTGRVCTGQDGQPHES
jgi:hypothetical protein